jgi:hypothetical protein
MWIRAAAIIGAASVLLVASVADASAPSIVRTYAGITCEWPTTHEGSVICHRVTGAGFAGVVAERFVMVKNPRGRVAFFRNQPTHSPGFGPFDDPRVFHKETHRGVICYWTRIGGGASGCNVGGPSGGHGYIVFTGHTLISVSNEASKVVYLKNQP